MDLNVDALGSKSGHRNLNTLRDKHEQGKIERTKGKMVEYSVSGSVHRNISDAVS